MSVWYDRNLNNVSFSDTMKVMMSMHDDLLTELYPLSTILIKIGDMSVKWILKGRKCGNSSK